MRTTGIAGLIVVAVGAYIASITLYATGSAVHRREADNPPAIDGTTVSFDAEEIQPNYSTLSANITVSPGPELLDPLTHSLKEDLTVAVTSVVAPTKRTWSKGMLPGVFPVPLTLTGHVEHWPFDRYHSGPITVELFHGAAPVPERTPVTFVDHLPGWKIEATRVNKADPLAPYRLELQRAPSTAAFASVILAVLIAIAGQGLFVAVQTLRDRRRFQPPMTTWYAAMLFAVMPLRNALPGSPPFGSWIDITVVLWVIVVLVTSMLLYIACWWRHLNPHRAAQPH